VTTRRDVLKYGLTASAAIAGAVTLSPRRGAAQGATIAFWHVYPGGTEIIQEINAGFAGAGGGITVEVTEIAGAYQGLAQRLQAAIAAGEPPAVVQVGYDALRYAAGVLPHLPVEAAAERGVGGDGARWIAENYPESVRNLGTVDGVLHFLPHSISTPVLWYNEDALARAGIQEPPRTWDEVREDAQRITRDTGLLGLEMTGYLWHMQAAVESNGGQVIADTDDGPRCAIDSPEAIEATRFLAEMALLDKSASFPALAQNQQTIGNFVSGRTAMHLTSSAGFGLFGASATFPFGSVAFPTWGDKPRRVPAGGNALGIFAEDEAQQAAAWEYIRFLGSPEALSAWDRATGYVPPQPRVAEDPQYLGTYYAENPAARAGLAQLPGVVPWASFPGQNGLEANSEIENAFARIFSGEQDVEPAYQQVAERINELIAE
jgi:multiple sugar transport system substrate-binding protein